MVRVRFAPSPTGHLHIGGLRTAIFNWLFAKHHDGTYLLRIEDTDLQRSTKEYLNSQLQSLQWMGLTPDEDPVFQMSRVQEHQRYVNVLLEQGKAYPCFCKPRDADTVVANLEQGVVEKYPGTCRNATWTKQDLEKEHAVRFKLPDGFTGVDFNDIIRGAIHVSDEHLDDMVIMRRDGSATYNFCVVIDDVFMKITHVVRGEDHLTNTAKQLLFYQALELSPPQFAHIPLILGKQGNKLSKRDAAASVESYRQQGFMADALLNYLVRLGWSHGDQEVFSKQELIEKFSLDAVGKKGAIFDMQKLEWLNGLYIRQAAYDELMKAITLMDKEMPAKLTETWSAALLPLVIEQYQQRSTTLKQLVQSVLALAQSPQSFDMSLVSKWHSDVTKPMIEGFASWVESQSTKIDKELALDAAKRITAEHGKKLVDLAQPLRLALTGSVQSPSVFDLMVILGTEQTSNRLRAMLQNM